MIVFVVKSPESDVSLWKKIEIRTESSKTKEMASFHDNLSSNSHGLILRGAYTRDMT